MGLVSGIVVYLLLWWWVFFMTLPFGVRPSDEPQEGHEPSAPVRPLLWRKAFITTILAFILWLGVDWIINSEIISFRELARE